MICSEATLAAMLLVGLQKYSQMAVARQHVGFASTAMSIRQ